MRLKKNIFLLCLINYCSINRVMASEAATSTSSSFIESKIVNPVMISHLLRRTSLALMLRDGWTVGIPSEYEVTVKVKEVGRSPFGERKRVQLTALRLSNPQSMSDKSVNFDSCLIQSYRAPGVYVVRHKEPVVGKLNTTGPIADDDYEDVRALVARDLDCRANDKVLNFLITKLYGEPFRAAEQIDFRRNYLLTDLFEEGWASEGLDTSTIGVEVTRRPAYDRIPESLRSQRMKHKLKISDFEAGSDGKIKYALNYRAQSYRSFHAPIPLAPLVRSYVYPAHDAVIYEREEKSCSEKIFATRFGKLC